MNTLSLTCGRGPYDGDTFTRIIEAIRNDGYIILSDIFNIQQLQNLFVDIKTTDSKYFHAAGIGRDQGHHLNRFVRRDRIRWLNRDYTQLQFYFDWIEQLRNRLNQELFLGLFDYECHYAHYPQGAFYRKHLDAFRGMSNRRMTTILYLNPDWQLGDGGELVLYAQDGQSAVQTISPCMGTVVLFLSEDFPHEVLASKRSRYSLTGWFRINATDSINLDPPEK